MRLYRFFGPSTPHRTVSPADRQRCVGGPAFLCAGPHTRALATMGWVLALNGRTAVQAFGVPFFVMLGSVAAFVGIADTCLGRRFAVWEVPTLSRGREERT